jgi:hypothetical protein
LQQSGPFSEFAIDDWIINRYLAERYAQALIRGESESQPTEIPPVKAISVHCEERSEERC